MSKRKMQEEEQPLKTPELDPDCWDRGTFLNITPISHGDEVVVDIKDIYIDKRGDAHGFFGTAGLVRGIRTINQSKTTQKAPVLTSQVLSTLSDQNTCKIQLR
jgi:hypothetical protein